jgi:hypothetical protein
MGQTNIVTDRWTKTSVRKRAQEQTKILTMTLRSESRGNFSFSLYNSVFCKFSKSPYMSIIKKRSTINVLKRELAVLCLHLYSFLSSVLLLYSLSLVVTPAGLC